MYKTYAITTYMLNGVQCRLGAIYENVKLNFVKNKIILLSKYYIYRIKLQKFLPNLNALKNYLKEHLNLEKYISFKTLSVEEYNKYWSPWAPIRIKNKC